MDSAIDSGVRPPMSRPTGARSRAAQRVGVGAEIAQQLLAARGRA